jgi:hypothetical protein
MILLLTSAESAAMWSVALTDAMKNNAARAHVVFVGANFVVPAACQFDEHYICQGAHPIPNHTE